MILKVGETDEGSFSSLSGVDKNLFPTFHKQITPLSAESCTNKCNIIKTVTVSRRPCVLHYFAG